MEALYLYLLKSSSLLALFFVAYHFLLRKETFFTSNRWFLLLGLFTSVVLPVVVYTKIIWVEPTAINYDWSNVPVRTVSEKNYTKEYIYLGLALSYCLGTLGLLTKFGFDFYNLLKIFKGKTIARQADFKFIDTTENVAPFSYFNTIVYNSSLYSSSELDNILEHEKIHSDQKHTIDVLLARVFCAVFWFNPFIWWYKNAILQNLEFIADSEATKKLTNKKAYQLTLLKITTHENCVAITNHFYQSLIKKRIVMLNKNQSNKRNSWKYATILPALVAFVLCFQIEVVAQEKNQIQNDNLMNVNYEINSFSTDKEIASDIKSLEKDFEINCSIAGIERNEESQITSINIILIDKNDKKQEFNIKGSQPIKPIKFFCYFNEEGQTEIGFYGKDGALVKNSTQNNHITENTEIFINGKKVTQKELESTNPDAIATMDVIKNNNESTIRIVTKGKTTRSTSVFNTDIEKTDSELDNIDPNNVSIRQKTKDSYSVTKVTKEVNGVPIDTEYYIDGKKVSPLEAESMNPNQITSVDVQKDGVSNKNSIRILTKSYIDSKGNQQQPPTPPTPPIPPTFNFNAPKAPNFPTAPRAPKGSPEKGDKKEWATFEQKMNAFNKKMEAMEPQMKEFDKKMAEFDEQMKIYEKQMEEYHAKIKERK